MFSSSLTSKAYGCYFTIDKFFKEIEITAIRNPTIIILCDNQLLLTRLHNITHHPITPSSCMLPEYEVIASIADKLKNLPQVSFCHILAHQTGDLSADALLNTKCDELATDDYVTTSNYHTLELPYSSTTYPFHPSI
jgi:hypothetical protein